ncbi:MAG: hypothetical protein ACR2GR_08365 [Rhodothermales bacterium]
MGPVGLALWGLPVLRARPGLGARFHAGGRVGPVEADGAGQVLYRAQGEVHQRGDEKNLEEHTYKKQARPAKGKGRREAADVRVL